MHNQEEDIKTIQVQEVQSEVIQINSNSQNKQTLTLYKIFGEASFSYEAAHGKSMTDWSGFYTQYSPIHSMRYLTKKWGDGSDFACLIKLYINFQNLRPMKLIKVSHSFLGKHSIEGKVKAIIIKRHLRQKFGINFGQDQSYPLLKRLGQERILLQCVDCDDEQVIIPHNLLTKQNFTFQGIGIFQKSKDGFMRTIGWKQYDGDEAGWKSVKGQQQFQPYLLINSCKELKQMCQ